MAYDIARFCKKHGTPPVSPKLHNVETARLLVKRFIEDNPALPVMTLVLVPATSCRLPHFPAPTLVSPPSGQTGTILGGQLRCRARSSSLRVPMLVLIAASAALLSA